MPASSDDDHAARFRQVFGEAVRCRLRASRAVAAEVSGGLDSSSVACEGERLRRDGAARGAPLTLIRAAFPGLACDERPYSQAVADHLGLPIETCRPAAEPEVCPLVQHYPDLYFHPTLTMLDRVLDDVRGRGVRSVLTGVGGDLLFEPTGYEVAHHLRRGSLFTALGAMEVDPRPLRWASLRQLARQGLWAFAPRAANGMRRARQSSLSPGAWLHRRAADTVREHLARSDEEVSRLHPDQLTAHLCRRVTHGVGMLLPMALQDRAGALRNIDFRHPFLDVRVVELLLALPLEQRRARHQTKGVLRRAMGAGLPSLVRDRGDKANFGSYVQRVFVDAQRAPLQRLLRTSRLAQLDLVDAGAVGKLLDTPAEAQSAFGLFSLAAMELWLRASIPTTFATNFPAPHEDRHEHV